MEVLKLARRGDVKQLVDQIGSKRADVDGRLELVSP